MKKLYPYQTEGVRWLTQRLSTLPPRDKGVLLADEPGLGKTIQAIRAISGLIPASYPRISQIGVVCPASVVEHWQRMFKDEFTGKYRLFVKSYEGAQRPEMHWPKMDFLILDEVHYLKTPESNRSRFILGSKSDGVGGLIARASKVIALSGTPTPNHPGEMWAFMRALFPSAITPQTNDPAGARPMDWAQFVNAFCVAIEGYDGKPKIVGLRDAAGLRRRLAPFVLRRKKSEVAEQLPVLSVQPHYLPLIPTVASQFMDFEAEAKEIDVILESGDISRLDDLTAHVATLRRYTGWAKLPMVAQMLEDWLKQTDDKIVVYGHGTKLLTALHNKFHKRSVLLRGSEADRQHPIDKFVNNTEIRIFFGQNMAAGTGLDGLQYVCSDGILVEPEWVPSVNEQIFSRLHRTGQMKPVQWRVPMFSNSIDERIQKTLIRKSMINSELWGNLADLEAQN